MGIWRFAPTPCGLSRTRRPKQGINSSHCVFLCTSAAIPVRRAGRTLAPQLTIDDATAELEAHAASTLAVPAALIREDALWGSLAKEHLERFAKLLGARALACNRELTWASACSGSEGMHFVVAAMQEAYKSARYDTSFVQCFACESQKEKQRWINTVINQGATGSLATCIFKNICDLGAEAAECVVHKGACHVPSVDTMITGTSCKDLSSLSSSGRSAGGLVLESSWWPGGSAQTFRGLISYVHAHRPSMVLFENVDRLADEVHTTSAGSSSRDEGGGLGSRSTPTWTS